MVTRGTITSTSPPRLQVLFNRMETGTTNENDLNSRMPALHCDDNECRNSVIDLPNPEDTEMAVSEESSLSCRDGAAAAAATTTTTATAAATTVFDAQVVEERDLQQEVQERMKNMTIDATLVVNVSSKKDENNHARADSRRKSTVTIGTVAATLIILIIASGTIIGTKKNLRPKPLETMVTASPTASISIWDFARDIFAPLSGEEALMDESSPQYKALSWIVHEDPTSMMMTMMVGNGTQSSSSSSMSMMILERYIMALLYFSTDGPNWVLQYDFLGNQSICDWGRTIRCSFEGAAVRISIGTRTRRFCSTIALNAVPVSQTLPNSPRYASVSFFSVSIVREVENNLNGTLPSELYAMSSLEHLSLWGNSLQGTLSSFLGRLTRLLSLQLGENLLTGSFPESFLDLRKLEILYMDENTLTGSLPAMPSSIESISIGFNFLTGTISELASFTNLQAFFLDSNLLSGSIPESIFSSSTLTWFHLRDNRISGSIITNQAENLVALELLDLSSNDMTGSIPSEIGLFKNLEFLYLNSNSFNGTIASQFGLLTRLEQLRLQDNHLSGSVPMELSSLVYVTSVKLFANSLTGSLDDVFCQQPTVVLLSKVDADCGGADPQVECTCCTTCCDSSSGNCTTNKEAVCLVEKSWHEQPDGPEYHEAAGTVCECTTTGSEDNATTTLSCRDTE
jgi:Leucine-rich repeat (LRR) protein